MFYRLLPEYVAPEFLPYPTSHAGQCLLWADIALAAVKGGRRIAAPMSSLHFLLPASLHSILIVASLVRVLPSLQILLGLQASTLFLSHQFSPLLASRTCAVTFQLFKFRLELIPPFKKGKIVRLLRKAWRVLTAWVFLERLLYFLSQVTSVPTSLKHNFSMKCLESPSTGC